MLWRLSTAYCVKRWGCQVWGPFKETTMGEVLGSIFSGYLLHYQIFYGLNYRPHLSHFWLTLGNFHNPNVVLILSVTFLTMSLPIFQSQLTRIFQLPKLILKRCDPILLTLLKIQPHYSHSCCENATPSSGISSLAFHRQVLISPLGNFLEYASTLFVGISSVSNTVGGWWNPFGSTRTKEEIRQR